MACNAWNTVGDLANVADIAGSVASGIVFVAATYKAATWGSPSTTLKESLERLREIKEKIDAVPAERRQRIEADAAMGIGKSLTHIEKQYQYLWDLHSAYCDQYEDASYYERHFPGTHVRSLISNLSVEVRGLLKETWTTTQGAVISNKPVPPPRDEAIRIPMHRLPAGSGSGSSSEV